MDQPIPPNFEVGTAKGDGDCFFDSVAQCLQQSQKQQRKKCTIKSLRKICAQHAKKSLCTDDSWLKTELENQMQRIEEYSENVVHCAEDVEHSTHLPMKDLIWGRPHIEGQILCSIFKVQLHVIHIEKVENREVWLHQVVDNNGLETVSEISYESKHMIHILNKGNGYYEPVLQTSFVRKSKSNLECIDFQKKEGTAAIKGHLYEIKLSMLFHLRGLRETDDFILASNVKHAGVFDDVIFKYSKMQDGIKGWKTIFLQAKHKEIVQSIGLDQLLAKKDFSLKLYFKSYLDIKKKFLNAESNNKIFRGNFKDCEIIIYTNIELHANLDQDLTFSKVKWEETDVGKMIGSRKGHIVQLKNNTAVIDMLRGEIKLLAQRIYDHTLGKNKGEEITDADEIVADYHISLANEVFEVNVNNPVESGFKEEFVNVKDPGEAKILFDELFVIAKQESNETEDAFRQRLKNAKVNLFPSFGKFPLQLEDSILENNVTDFLNQFYIFFGQSQESELDEIIKEEIGDTYGENQWHSNTIFANVKNSVEIWWKADRFFLTKEHQYFLDEKHCIQQNELGIDKLVVQLKEGQIQKWADLITEHQFVNIVADKGAKLLSIIPVIQALDRNPEWKDRRWIFMNLDQLLCAESHILQGYYSKKVLVIECTWRSEHFAALQELSRRMQGNIKIVFITEQFELRNVCGEYFKVHTEYDNSTFKGLTAESQKMIWAKKVNFQGMEVELSDLIDIRDENAENVISSQTLMQLIKNDDLNVCNEPPRLSHMEAAYAKLYTEIPIHKLVEGLLKMWEEHSLFLICGVNNFEKNNEYRKISFN